MLAQSIKRGGGLLALAGSLLLGLPGEAQAQTYVHLFEWRWPDIAKECETFLGPKGYTAVQVSPPNEHITGGEWWARYQPVSYKLDSRGGSRAQFIDMVQRCNAAGVAIYADLVVNHTAAGSGGTGSGGSTWSNRRHPMFSPQDYHSPVCTISNYQDAWNVQNCDLVGLPDLNTGASYVQQTIANYINDLTSIGVKGYRIDAAKHMSSGDISGIKGRLTGSPYIFQEVIDLGGEAVTASQYFGNGTVTEFKYSANIGTQFKTSQIKNLNAFGESWGFMSGDRAVVFTDNHDNQRGHGAGGANVLTYKDGNLYTLANVFMLGWPYGYPQVMSSYAFSNTDAGPPGGSVHNGSTVDCFGSNWQCEHRWRPIANMVTFRKTTQGAAVSRWWDNGNNQVAFARTGKGFVVINREGGTLSRSFATGLPAGTYCNIITGDFANGTCSGSTITVDAAGNASFSVPGMTAAAIHINAKGSGGGGGDGYTKTYPQVYFRGTANNWGATAMTLVANNTWQTTATFGSTTTERFKFDIYGDWTLNFGDTQRDGIAESGGGDIPITQAGTYTLTFNDSTLAYTAQRNSGGGGGTVAVTFTCNNGQTVTGQSVYLVGSHSTLGTWAPASAIKLTPSSYPTWIGTVSLPASTAIEWKCLKRNDTDATQGVQWQGGGNNALTIPASGTASASASF
ncbi:carbohydrate-binding module family 20 domain-containing protein [Stigmatella sp. ncwal1]|uniref:Alpha-amylase n=1 Tax=Stigmatella ashevillensis TaxID=2995309 RepID=A0ABT5DBK9_9BACT|nr:carbohydrate-binding module family 20 domain-containing protein [Stigmatella ashevillena]MDC0711060.1 carbohydrate-binding module family 20 domain-containing protein [Stigmatella ashevillena]